MAAPIGRAVRSIRKTTPSTSTPAIPAVGFGLVKPPPGMSDLDYVVGHAGERVVMINAAGTNQGADAPLKRQPPPPAAPQPRRRRLGA